MLSGGPDTASLPRDTVFVAVMISTNGIVGTARGLNQLGCAHVPAPTGRAVGP